jgi:DNA-binding transcriptional LysR family regulator
MNEQGCLYRNRMIHAAEAAGRAWHMAYTSPNLSGIQAAVSVGLGVSILPEVAIQPAHRVLKSKDGFPPITNTEVALVAAPNASPAACRLAELLCAFCSTADRRSAPPNPRAVLAPARFSMSMTVFLLSPTLRPINW